MLKGLAKDARKSRKSVWTCSKGTCSKIKSFDFLKRNKLEFGMIDTEIPCVMCT